MLVCLKIAGRKGLKSVCAKFSVDISRQTITCPKSRKETLAKVVKHVQS